MQESEVVTDLSFSRWDIAIVGPPLDDRGKSAIDFVTKNSNSVITFEYNSEDFTLRIDGADYDADDLESYLLKLNGKTIIFESTTLGFVEIFLCCKGFHSLGIKKLSFLYVEPKNYQKPMSTMRKSQLLHKRDFELSQEVPGYKAIPGGTLLLTDRIPQKTVFFLGFEERRLDRALEDYQMIQPSSASVVFGVPAFKPGWEMDAFANNIRVIRERNIKGGVHFCGAENPASAIRVLKKIKKSLEINERLFVAPIGTKPMGIGAALFAATNNDVGLLYDHPKRSVKRSSDVARWHIYNADLN